MAAITDLSDLLNLITGGGAGAPEKINFNKDFRVDAAAAVATIAGRFTSLWQYEGNPAGGAAPGAVAVPVNTTDGGIKQTDPGGGRTKWLLWGSATSSQQGTLILYDRLLHISGLSGTVITAQTVGGSLTRYLTTESVGNQIWVEIYTQIGSTATTITASYTDEAGNSGSTTTATAFGGTGAREAQRMIILPLASGDSGVRAVASVTVLASTLTAGDFGVNIVHPLLEIPVPQAAGAAVRDLISGLPTFAEIKTDACLAWAWVPAFTTAPQIMGSVQMVEK